MVMESTLNRPMRKNWYDFGPLQASVPRSVPSDPTTTLADELYELMSGDGATPAAVREMPALMSLTYIRAEAPSTDEDALDEAVAATARAFIEQATYALEEPVSQRDDKDADRGAAARCLLGLYPGTGSMLLAERRRCAAEHLVKKVRTMTKRRERKGRVISHEMVLMEQLASQLWDRETDFLKQRDRGEPERERQADEQLLQVVHTVWKITGELDSELGVACYLVPPDSADRYPFDSDHISLYHFGQFWKLVHAPEREFIEAAEGVQAPLVTLFPPGLIAQMYVLAPFQYTEIDRLANSTLPGPYMGSSQVMMELISRWRVWLQSCWCNKQEPQPTCQVHRFREALLKYQKAIEECWANLRDPHRSPAVYGFRRTPTETLEYYAIRSIDKYDINSV